MKHRVALITGICLTAAAAMSAYTPARAADAKKDAPRKVELVSHRGESYDAPENTLAAINLAWDRGVQSVEMDLHLSADGKLITIHDKDTLRVTGGPKHGGQKMVILESNADALRKLDVGTWKAPPWKGEKLPLFDEVLATLPKEKDRRLFVEIKVGPEAAGPTIAAIKSAGRPPAQTAVISFNLDTCAEVKRQMPELKVYFLSSFAADKKTGKIPTIEGLIQQAKDAKLDGLDLSFKGPLDAAGVKQIHDAGLECYVWTVDELDVAKRFAAAGVDGITTNRGLWLGDELEAAAAKAAKK